MLKWVRRYFVWLCFTLSIAGCEIFGFGWLRHAHINEVMSGGEEAIALINRAQSISRKSLVTNTISLTWKDQNNKTRNATGIPISNSFAEHIITNGTLMVPSAEIRYLLNSQDTLPVIVGDADVLRKNYGQLQFQGLIIAILGALGSGFFGWFIPRIGAE